MASEPITGETYGEEQARQRTRSLLLAEAEKPLIELLPSVEKAHAEFVACLQGVSDAQAAYQPSGQGENAFSIAQVARHVSGSGLIMAERLLYIARGETPKRATSPGYFGDVETESLPQLLQALNGTLSALREVVAEVEGKERLDSVTPHPMFGELNCRAYLRLIGLHFEDHVHQVAKIKTAPAYPVS